MRLPLRSLLVILALVLATAAQAQNYPDRPIRLIVPFAAGGTVDIIARIVGGRLADVAGAKVIIDNRGGAGGVIGTELVAQSPGDGYTLLFHSGSITYDPSLHDKLPYDTMKDLAPVSMIGTTPNLLVVTPSFPARSAADLIRMVREKPGSITYATGGFGSSSHLAVALLGSLSGTKFNHVP
jgi:tripartite-type tricarboxylate transporter receptor subunit TctC